MPKSNDRHDRALRGRIRLPVQLLAQPDRARLDRRPDRRARLPGGQVRKPTGAGTHGVDAHTVGSEASRPEVRLGPNWEHGKVAVMEDLVRLKFADPALAA